VDVNVQLRFFSAGPGLVLECESVISITAEYALRAATFLARAGERARTTQQIAGATRVPASYLSKVLQLMARADVIRSVRGIYGGYQLTRRPNELTVLQVINSVDPIRRIERCPLGLPEHHARLCRLHRRVDAATALVEEAFRRTTIGELVGEDEHEDACDFPEADNRDGAGQKTRGPAQRRKRCSRAKRGAPERAQRQNAARAPRKR